MALSGSGSVINYTTRTFGPFTRGGVSPWSRTTGLQVTLSCWVRCRAAPSQRQTFFGIGDSTASTFFQLVVDTNFVFRAWYANSTATTQAIALSASNAAAVGDWVHLMGTLDCTSNPRATLFIGGTSYTAASGLDTSTASFSNVTLHRRPSGLAVTPALTTTDVAEAAVYAGLLNADDAEALRCGQNPVSVEGHRLLAYFPLRNDVQDRSPYAIGLTQAASYTLAWSDHPPVEQEPRRRFWSASIAAPIEVIALSASAASYADTPAVSQIQAVTALNGVSSSSSEIPAVSQIQSVVASSSSSSAYSDTPAVQQLQSVLADSAVAQASATTPVVAQIQQVTALSAVALSYAESALLLTGTLQGESGVFSGSIWKYPGTTLLENISNERIIRIPPEDRVVSAGDEKRSDRFVDLGPELPPRIVKV